MRTIAIDIETFSSVCLAKCGVYQYAASPDFEILLFGYSVDGGPVRVVDLAQGERIPENILAALEDDTVLKCAHNAAFERTCLGRYLGHLLSPKSWRCTMVWAATLGLPLSLAGAGAVLRLDEQKMNEGKELIRYFCVPVKSTHTNGGRTRNRPQDAPEKWETFKAYNKRDVEVEMAIAERLRLYPVPDFEWGYYAVDQRINDRGILVDRVLAENAVRCDELSHARDMARAQEITGLENPNSPLQLMEWLRLRGVEISSLTKKDVAALLGTAMGDVREMLLLRQRLSKTSVKKYAAMLAVAGADGRARGLFQFDGAGRTGRWAGRLVQLQNLRRNSLPDLAAARNLVRRGDFELLEMLYGDTADVLSQLVRTAFVPRPGCRFIVADYSAIEARVLAWLAGEEWVLDVFRDNGDIYCATAGKMFHKRVIKHGENGELRQKGKQCTLSCGYGGSVGALKAMGAIEAGMKEDELQPLVDLWRESNPHIVEFWRGIDDAAKTAIRERGKAAYRGIECSYERGMLFISLPSGRRLAYVRPRIGENRFGSESVTYEGTGATRKWERLETFGGKLTENITQAVARDLLAAAMQRITERGFDIVMHVHDEVVVEVPEGVSSVEEICAMMAEPPAWAKELPLKADGYECKFYQKD